MQTSLTPINPCSAHHDAMHIVVVSIHNVLMQQAAKYTQSKCSEMCSSESLVYDRAAPLEGGVGWTQPALEGEVGWTQPALPPSLTDATGSSG